MSILIKGMEMPTSCQNCFASDDESRFCKAAKEYIPMLGKPKFCPLVPAPPHGRLIEADCIELYMQDEWMNNELSNGDWILFRERLKEVPTIIPADKEGEG